GPRRGRSTWQPLPEPGVVGGDPGQGEEEATPHREDVLLQGLPLEAGLDGQAPPGQALLVADEGEALVESPGVVEPAGEVEAAAQDAAAGRLGGPRVGHADVGV